MVRILLLTYNSVMTSGILQSQVAGLLKQLKSCYPEDLDFYLITAEKWKDFSNQKKKESFTKEMASSGIKVYILPKFLPSQLRKVSTEESINSSLVTFIFFLLDMFLLGSVSLWVIFLKRINILHARSYIPAILALALKQLTGRKVIFDPRGIIPEELQLTKNWSATDSQYLKWKKVEKKLLIKSDAVIVLSHPFREHYQKIIPSLEPVRVPCAVDMSHFRPYYKKAGELQESLGLKDKFIVLYTMGHYVPYQDFDSAINLFTEILLSIPNAHFLILSPDVIAIKIALKKHLEESQYTVMTVEYSQMPEYICMSHVGILVRVPSPITAVSSPVKLPEYLACGVPVIAQPGIGDTDLILSNHITGIILENGHLSVEDILWLKQLSSTEFRLSVSKECILLAKSHFSWDIYLNTYYQLYTRLASITR